MTFRHRGSWSRHSGVGTSLVGGKIEIAINVGGTSCACHRLWTVQRGGNDLQCRHSCCSLLPWAMCFTAIAKKSRPSFLGSYKCFISRHSTSRLPLPVSQGWQVICIPCIIRNCWDWGHDGLKAIAQNHWQPWPIVCCPSNLPLSHFFSAKSPQFHSGWAEISWS